MRSVCEILAYTLALAELYPINMPKTPQRSASKQKGQGDFEISNIALSNLMSRAFLEMESKMGLFSDSQFLAHNTQVINNSTYI